MHNVDKLPQPGVRSLVRADMTKSVGPNGKRPLVNPFPDGVRLMSKFTKMGHHYAYGSRHSKLMMLRDSAGLNNCSAELRIKVCGPL